MPHPAVFTRGDSKFLSHKPARSPTIRNLLAYRDADNTFPIPPATATISVLPVAPDAQCNQLAQLSGRFQQRTQQGFFHIACTNDPRGNAVDRGIKEVEADMHPVKQIVTNNLTGNRLGFIIQ
ncbi:hypothetical protein WRSd5_02365 [Shigella dysenteriae WRSd5]|uniref:Uncharacterized protein n=1 Tax=Shigella dysenteriae 1617 TaxID=754093 RepID=A0A0A7A1H5_SHIDY|nr:hypothetical protein Asd1617_05047 [Shigella dysenteriae 1617]ESU82831.1 hypothetical protein WRSd5_02365 [Shigella dysenteriae WRSd5]